MHTFKEVDIIVLSTTIPGVVGFYYCLSDSQSHMTSPGPVVLLSLSDHFTHDTARENMVSRGSFFSSSSFLDEDCRTF